MMKKIEMIINPFFTYSLD